MRNILNFQKIGSFVRGLFKPRRKITGSSTPHGYIERQYDRDVDMTRYITSNEDEYGNVVKDTTFAKGYFPKDNIGFIGGSPYSKKTSLYKSRIDPYTWRDLNNHMDKSKRNYILNEK